MGDGDHILLSDRGAALSGSQFDTSAIGKAFPVDPGVVDGFTHCAAMEAIDEAEQHRRLSVDNWRWD